MLPCCQSRIPFTSLPLLLTAIGRELHSRKVIAQHLRIGVISVVIATPTAGTLTGILAILLLLLALRWPSLIALVKVLLNLLLDVVEPAIDLFLRLHESLLQVVTNHRQVVIEEAVLTLVIVPTLLRAGPWPAIGSAVRCASLVCSNVVVVLSQLPGVQFVGFHLGHLRTLALRARRPRGRCSVGGLIFSSLGIGHFCNHC